jgi:hypothetical protein
VGRKRKKAGEAGQKVTHMKFTTKPDGDATAVSTIEAIADFDDAISKARIALLSAPLDSAIVGLEDASRLAVQVKNPHAHELAYLVDQLKSAFETRQLVRLCFHDKFPEH